MSFKRLSLTMIFVRDYQAMKDWYTKSFGLELDESMTADEGMWAEFKFPAGDGRLAIHGGLPVPEVTGMPHVVPAIEVDDIEQVVSQMKERGVMFRKDPRPLSSFAEMGGPMLLAADFSDPEGNVLQLIEVKR